MAEAITDGGGLVSPLADAKALVWGAPAKPEALVDVLEQAPHLEWVQLPWAGIEPYIDVIDDDRLWTCAKGVYAEPVAELALTLGPGGLRGISDLRPGRRRGSGRPARTCWVGGSRSSAAAASPRCCCRLLMPFDAHVTVVRNRVRAMDGADVVVESDHLHNTLPGADLVVVALALTPDTEGIIGADELRLMERHAWLVNVARGRHVVTDDLVERAASGHDRRRRRSTSPNPSHCPTGTRSGRCRTASSRPTWATRRRWPSRCSPSGSPRTSGAGRTASSS